MTLDEIKQALIGKTLYYWEIDSCFSTDEHCEVIRDMRLNDGYNPQIVFDKYDFDLLPLSEIERLIQERKIKNSNCYVYYECEIMEE